MAVYQCPVCGYLYDETYEEVSWSDLPDDWECPVCETPKSLFTPAPEGENDGFAPRAAATLPPEEEEVPRESLLRSTDAFESDMADIHAMAATGRSIVEPMRTRIPTVSWDDLLIRGAQLARAPLDHEEEVSLETVIGSRADKPLVIEAPVFVSHMSYGALSREAKVALAKGSAAAGTATCSGEGGILPESKDAAKFYIFEYVPNLYGVTEENLRSVDAIEIKIGQSAKPGMGGHLPGEKVTEEIAEVRGFPQGKDIHSPSRFKEIITPKDLEKKIGEIREISLGRPVGVKIAAGHVEADVRFALEAEPDFITIDGRAGATAAAPKFVKRAASVPTIYALHRARKVLDDAGADGIALIVTGGLRISPDFVKALALGADAVAIATSALMAIGCQQYRICDSGKCPMGITTQDPLLRRRLDVDEAAAGLSNFLQATWGELRTFSRLTGHRSIHELRKEDLCCPDPGLAAALDIDRA